MDCGVFVCLEIKYLLTHRLLRYHKADKISMSLGDCDLDPARGRKSILAQIEMFRKEGERRRSYEIPLHLGTSSSNRMSSRSESPRSTSNSKSRTPPRID